MTTVVASAPGKIILFGEHSVHRGQPNLTTAVDLRTFCRVTTRPDTGYSFRSGERYEIGEREQLLAFKAEIDALREAKALDEIGEKARDFYAPPRYVLASILEQVAGPGLDIEWRSQLPIGSGLGSGAAASASMTLAAFQLNGYEAKPDEVIYMAWQGDIIAHGGIGSSLDSSTCVLGGLISYTLADKAQPLPFKAELPLIIGDTLVQHSTATVNTHIRKWLEEHPARNHIFADMGYLIQQALVALKANDLATLGHLMSIHQLLQEKLGTSCPEIEHLVEVAIGAGALGAKISGSGGGGIIIALVEPDRQAEVAAAIDAAGGRGYQVTAGAEGVRIESDMVWETMPE